ncbi:MAG TPA: two-component regulator propeller domain-containing protein [Tenuifilaceae bacterium]|nr:two-component regulator propeller domain-containing protein [Tenuifilaceae bacterium]HPQ35774.1 two-component regulator propeller domain-containing protein [Tenuifilaceae bacterium]
MKITRNYSRFITKLLGVWLCLFIVNTHYVKSQNSGIVFEKLSIRDGLSHNNVYSILQDSLGYMWFGTQDGLNRYDGKTITVFRNDPTNPNSIATANFGKIHQDRKGNYWFGTFGGGVDVYNPKTNELKNYSYNPNNINSISNNQVLFIFEDNQSRIWIGTPDGGLNLFISENKSFKRFQHNPLNPKSLSSKRAKCMCQTPDGILWIGTDNGLNKLNEKENSFSHYKFDPKNTKGIGGSIIQNMIANEDGTIWIVLRDGGLNLFNPQNGEFTKFTKDPANPNSLNDNKADCILKDSYGNIWVGTYEGGLNKFDPVSKTFTHYTNNPSLSESISSNRIECLYEDNSQILWIGTRGGGISKLDLKPKKFHNITHNPLDKNSLQQHSIMAITSDKHGNIWIGSDGGGLSCYNPKDRKFKHFTKNNAARNGFTSNRIWSLLIDDDGILWIGTYDEGLCRLSFENDEYTFTPYKHDPENPKSISNNQINYLMVDCQNDIWIATANGLNKLIKKGKPANYSFTRSYHNPATSTSFADNYVNSVIQSTDGKVWIGSYQSGLYELNEETGTFINHTDSTQFPGKLKLLSIFEDSQQNLWVGTESRGLLKYDRIKNEYIQHPNNHELSKNMVLNIIEDNEGRLWISSTRGLSKYSPIDGRFNTYSITDGIEGDGFNRNAAHKTESGILYFGSNAGITYFNPNQVVNNPHEPKIAITDFKVLNHSICENLFTPSLNLKSKNNTIVLTHRDYFFSIDFASFDFTTPEKNQYKYMLEGFNEDWVEIGNNTSATFTNLSHGTYTFKVTGTNNDFVWSSELAELRIVIIPPIWKRNWFIVMEILLVVIVILSYIRFRTRKLMRDKKILEEKVKERTYEISQQKEELESTLEKLKNTQAKLIQSEKMASMGILTSGIAHEINNPLNYIQGGINVVSDYVNENFEDKHTKELNPIIEMIEEGVKRAALVVRSLNRLNTSYSTTMDQCNVNKIIENCLLVLHNQFENKIIVEKNFSEQEPIIYANEAKFHQAFISILLNAEQAIRGSGKISISTTVTNENVVLSIEDNGIGISEENLPKITDPFFTTKDPGKGIGLGLSIVYSIIQEHNGTIDFISELEKGTTVRITLPLYKQKS